MVILSRAARRVSRVHAFCTSVFILLSYDSVWRQEAYICINAPRSYSLTAHSQKESGWSSYMTETRLSTLPVVHERTTGKS